MTEKEPLWTVRNLDELKESDLILVSDFFNEHFPGVFYPRCTPEIFAWKLGESNPSGRGFLTVAICENQVIGTTSGTRRELIYNGSQVPGMEIGDTFTHPDFRRGGVCATPYVGEVDPQAYLNKSIFGRLVTETLDRASKAGVIHVFGTPNENSRPPYLKRLGFKEIGWGEITTWSSVSPSITFQGRLGPLLKLLANCTKVLQNISVQLGRVGYSVGQVDFQSIHNSIKGLPTSGLDVQDGKNKLELVRGSEFLSHRFWESPTNKYEFFEARHRQTVIGLFITTSLVRSSGRKTLVISDWFGDGHRFKRKLPLFISLISKHYPNVEIVSAWSEISSTKSMTWHRFGFVGRKNVSLIYKSLGQEKSDAAPVFPRFRFGWSDNG